VEVNSDREGLQRIVAESKLATRLQPKAGAVVALVARETMEIVEVGIGVDASTSMEIGSLTKVFTALLLAEAIGRDELKLADRIDRVLLGLSWAGAPAVTIEELATHTSGVPRLSFGVLDALRSNPYLNYTREDLLAWIMQRSRAVLRTPHTVTAILVTQCWGWRWSGLRRRRLDVYFRIACCSRWV
jgi:CubicO group peptidase (beta-lactamase class C family)